MQVVPVQRKPLAVQKPPPPVIALAPQQICVDPPHGVPSVSVHEPALHVPDRFVPLHACPAPTHMRVVPPPSFAIGMQQPSPSHLLPPQQTSPGVPQAPLPSLLASFLPPDPPPPSTREPPLPPWPVDVGVPPSGEGDPPVPPESSSLVQPSARTANKVARTTSRGPSHVHGRRSSFWIEPSSK